MYRPYFSQRKEGIKPLDLDQVKRLFGTLYSLCDGRGYFREAFGGTVNENGESVWYFGTHEPAGDYVLLRLRRDYLWPISTWINKYTEGDLFDIIEFLYDNISKPIIKVIMDPVEQKYYWDGEYDEEDGKTLFRKEINIILSEYNEGYELTENGEIVRIGEEGLREIFAADLPTEDERIIDKVNRAVTIYRNRHSDVGARRTAVRELVDVIERLKPNVKKYLTHKDERELFNIANNFLLRHDNDLQKAEYGPEWLAWFFYLYLSTIHLCLRLMKRGEAAIL